MSDRKTEEVSKSERQYKDGSDPQLLDIMNVSLLRPKIKSESPQRENWLLDTDFYWEKHGRMHRRDLASLVDREEPLWLNTGSERNGLNYRIPVSFAGNLDSSLRLIQVEKLTLSVFAPGEYFGNPERRVQGQFRHAGDEYHFWVTDPEYERFYRNKGNGKYEIGVSFLTVSLSEPHEDYYYKFIAAIIPCDGTIVK